MKKHIRLNMIVKNEAHVILRCLSSLKPWISSWCIVDTGSTDGTQKLIQEYLADLPGQLYERPWKNFGFNRTEALKLAVSSHLPSADYLLFIDADEQLRITDSQVFENLEDDAYYASVIYGGLRYKRNALISTRLDWEWKGVLHEYLDSNQLHKWHDLNGLNIFVQHDGARAKDKTTYLKDINLLEEALKDEPDNTRYLFYLAQSYRDAGMLEKSRELYLKRASLGGWQEECWMAKFRAAQMADRLNLDENLIYREYLKCWIEKQNRAEPLYELARYYRYKKDYDLSCYFAIQALEVPFPKEGLFIEASVYEWRILDELSVSATYCKAYKSQGKDAISQLLKERKYPEFHHKRILANLTCYK